MTDHDLLIRIDESVSGIQSQLIKGDVKFEDHGERIRALEDSNKLRVGYVAGISAFCVFVSWVCYIGIEVLKAKGIL